MSETISAEILVEELSSSPSDYLSSFEAFFFDCDGVLWHGRRVLPGVQKLLETLKWMGKMVFYLSNNSTLTREQYLHKFQSLGLPAEYEQMIPSSYSVALHLKSQNFDKSHKKAYIIGEKGIIDELNSIGITCLGGPEDSNKTVDRIKGPNVDNHIGAVIVGYDRSFNYYKLQYGLKAIKKYGAQFIATNCDALSPSENEVWAAAGSMVAALSFASGINPTVTGKPSSLLFDHVKPLHNLDPEKCVMIGDRFDTDILFGKNCGMNTILVLTGVTSKTQLSDPTNTLPDYYCEGVEDFLKYLPKMP